MPHSAVYAILQPVVALLMWSLVMWLWMLLTRVPAMMAMKIALDPALPPRDLTLSLPARVRWKADNYNHLMEAPTLFYAAALVIAVTDPANSLAIASAWAYVALRVAHSLVQALINNIPSRLFLFVLSTIALASLVWCGAHAVFGG